MKKSRFFYLAMMLCTLAFGLTSCEKDDNDGGSGSGSGFGVGLLSSGREPPPTVESSSGAGLCGCTEGVHAAAEIAIVMQINISISFKAFFILRFLNLKNVILTLV